METTNNRPKGAQVRIPGREPNRNENMQKDTANPVVGSARFLVDTAPVLESGERSPCSDDVSASRRAKGRGAARLSRGGEMANALNS